MPNVVGIRFKSCGKIYDFDAEDVELHKGDCVVIESDIGLSIGSVIEPPRMVDSTPKQLRKVLRIASTDDMQKRDANAQFEKEAQDYCQERISARGLPMRLVCAESTLDRKRILFYFTADSRVDFRELVKDLAAKFRTRIELRQIGVRDKAKLVGGLGMCGRELCCRLFLTEFAPISIKMAKKQELALNTGKLSGCCGRLMCCLGYEYQEKKHGQSREAEDEPETVTPLIEEASAGVSETIAMPEEGSADGDSIEEETHAPTPEPAAPSGQQEAGQQGTGQDATGQRRRRRRRRRRHKKKPGAHEQ